MIHFEVSAVGNGPDVAAPLYTSPYIAKNKNGSTKRTSRVRGITPVKEIPSEQKALRVEVSTDSLCLSFTDLNKSRCFLRDLSLESETGLERTDTRSRAR